MNNQTTIVTMSQTWPTVALGQLLKRVERYENRSDLAEYQFAGTYSFGRGIFVSQRKMGSEFRLDQVQRIHYGDFVYCKIMAWEGAFGLVPPEADQCVMSGAFVTYEPEQSRLDSQYLSWYFKQKSIWEGIGSQSTGTNVRRRSLHPDQFERAAITLPPIDEQRRIVARIAALAAKIEQACGLRREAVELAELFLINTLAATRLSLLRKHKKVKLGAITTVTAGGTPSRDVEPYWGGDIPWIKTGELLDGMIHNAEETITQLGLDKSSAKLFPCGTVLIALYGQGQTRGRTGLLAIQATTNQACSAILPKQDILEPRFTQYWLRSLYTEMREQNHGGAQPNWNARMIKDIEIALPSITEQQHVIAKLDDLQARVDALKRLQAETAVELDGLLPSVLDRAFSGHF